jgi:hypothetical protein
MSKISALPRSESVKESLAEDSPTKDAAQCTVNSFTFSDHNTDSTLTVIYCGIRTDIDILAANLELSPKKLTEYLHFLKVADAWELDGITVEDFYDWVLEGCRSTFAKISRPILPTAPTLANYLYPETQCYYLHADEHDTLQLKAAANGLDRRMPPGTRVSSDHCSSWPSFTASQVVICSDDLGTALQCVPQKVQVESCESFLFFKSYDLDAPGSAKRELDTYAKTRQTDLVHLRISKLFGLVHSDSGLLLGLLLYHIDCNKSTLRCAARRPTVTLSVRQYWAAEVTETLTRLHESGIVWGDAKPDNILVDTQKDPWIIDFGGGYTQGWVEKDLAGTVEGDRQGLSRIVDYVFERGRSDII